MKKIVLTGGGTAGHVTPNIALLPRLKELGYEIHYIGSYDGIEKKLIEQCGIPYYGISSGKLRRYFDWKNFSDPFKVIKGYGQARALLRNLKPDVLFSKGGFVSVPVVMAAKHRKIPAVIHESDITPGLANKLAIPNASKVCCNFPETLKYLPSDKAVLTGSPIRQELLSGRQPHQRAFLLQVPVRETCHHGNRRQQWFPIYQRGCPQPAPRAVKKLPGAPPLRKGQFRQFPEQYQWVCPV